MSDNTQEISESESRECMNTISETFIIVYNYIKYILAIKVIMMM